MKFRFTGFTDPGLVRSINQDAYHIDPEGQFFIVADGMGGHAGGEEASRIATQVIQAYFVEHWDSVKPNSALLEGAFFQANQAIVQEQQQHPERFEMGTTAVAVIFREHQPWVAHVGDSRLYRLRSSKLEQMTEDHTLVAIAFKSGEITPEEARTHPYRHILSRCLGRTDLHEIDVQALDVQAGDRLLLCSDGLTEELSDHLITSYLQSNPAVDQAGIALVKAALANGGHDNITVVILAINQ
jgi:protein phosphatase